MSTAPTVAPPPTRDAATRLPPAAAFALVAGIIGLTLFASATPSPLYADYAARWGFSTVVLTIVYAVYAFGVLAALLLVGRLSDELGRRPVIATALGTLMLATVLFMAAQSVVWLLVARAVQGVATGAALGAAGAALLDLAPGGDARRAALVNGVGSALGMGSGALVAALLVEYAPAPRVTPFVVLFALFAVALAGALALPEPVQRSGRARLRVQRPDVPRAMRRPFAVAAGGIFAAWSVGGLYLTLAPSLTQQMLHTHSHVAGGLAVFSLAGAGALAQVVFNGITAERAMQRGAVTLAAGMVALALSLSTGSVVVFLLASALTGTGFGVASMGAIRVVSTAAPAQHRAAVMSAFYVVAYVAISLPAIGAGLAVTDLGLEATFRVFALIAAALSLATAVASHRGAAPDYSTSSITYCAPPPGR
jgi:MFS family permease